MESRTKSVTSLNQDFKSRRVNESYSNLMVADRNYKMDNYLLLNEVLANNFDGSSDEMDDTSIQKVDKEEEHDEVEKEDDVDLQYARFAHLCDEYSDFDVPIAATYQSRLKNFCKKINMLQRREIFLPPSEPLMRRFRKQISYFSESVAKDQWITQALNDIYFKEKLGQYDSFDARVLTKVNFPDEFKSVSAVTFSKDGAYVAIGFGCGITKIYEVNKKYFHNTLYFGDETKILRITEVPKLNEHLFVATTSRGDITVTQFICPIWVTIQYASEHNNEINAMDFSSSGCRLVTGGRDATIRVYDFATASIIREYKRRDLNCEYWMQRYYNNIEDEDNCHYRRIYALKFKDNDNNIFLTGGGDNTVKIWDLRIPNNPVRNIYGPHIVGDALDILDNKILTGQWKHKNSIELWDLRCCRKLHTMSPLNRQQAFVNEFPYCCKFMRYLKLAGMPMAHGDVISVGGSGFGGLEVQSISINSIVQKYVEAGQIVTIAQNENLIVYGTTSCTLAICDFYARQPEDKEEEDELSRIEEEEEEQMIGQQCDVNELGEKQINWLDVETKLKGVADKKSWREEYLMRWDPFTEPSTTSTSISGSSSSSEPSTDDEYRPEVNEEETVSEIDDLLESAKSSISDTLGKYYKGLDNEKKSKLKENLSKYSADSEDKNIFLVEKIRQAFRKNYSVRRKVAQENLESDLTDSESSSDDSGLVTYQGYVSSDNSIFNFPSDVEFPT